jgi:integrase
MRIKAMFTVFARVLPSGKRVYYYQCYNEKGKRQWAKSTGLSTKTEATAFCMKLFRDGLLIPEQKLPLFSEFSAGWWDIETSRYLKWRQLHDPITPGTMLLHKSNFDCHIKGYFAKYRLDEITPGVIESWLLALTGQGLKYSTVNLQYRTFKLMMAEAVRMKLLKNNPCLEVKELKGEGTEREILSVGEARSLFPPDWRLVWDSHAACLAHKLAACTGVRIGELRGLKCEFVYGDYIRIAGQYGVFKYLPYTKTKQSRNIPIAPLMRQELEGLLLANKGGFVFSDDGGATPLSADRIYAEYSRALGRIGISAEEKRKRNLTFHSWRHFLNTLLRMSNVADGKVQKVTGHLSMKMTEHYTHFDARQFTEVRNVQAELLAIADNTVEKTEKKKATA